MEDCREPPFSKKRRGFFISNSVTSQRSCQTGVGSTSFDPPVLFTVLAGYTSLSEKLDPEKPLA